MNLLTLSEAVFQSNQIRQAGQKLIFTNGCFDILHAGHVQYLQQARVLGDVLWVGLNSDVSVRALKGPSRPVNSEHHRALVLSALSAVDGVVLFSESTPVSMISKIQPDVYVKGGDYRLEDLPEYPVVTGYGGRVELLSFFPGSSTTDIIQSIQERGE
ncbi:MAG: D-glycero-beta-D-manno-heptose 1-phosphate adenylyltransferase [Actinobacteria bacterium]|nr:D-glycero-beta-D-manno-heptose 1-phosphate adenylyltransferase [Actinomycetota bacterium]